MAEKPTSASSAKISKKKKRASSKKRQANAKKPARSGTAAPSGRIALVVLGMHRSGTSALAGVLGLRGAKLPNTPIPPNARNPRGFFESEILYALHDELLREAGTAWDDLSPLPADFFESASADAWVARLAQATADEYGDADLTVLKDPRMCRIVPLWRRVLAELGAEPRFVLPIRNPLECAASLTASYGISTSTGLLLWLEYFLAAERDTRDAPRTFHTYEALLSEPAAVIAKLEKELDVGLPRTSRVADAEVADFLSRDLHRQVADPEEIFARGDVHVWVAEAYRWALRAAAGGRKPGFAALDAIREQLAVAETAFGPALAESEVARRRGLDALEARLADQGKQTHETTRMLMRWIVDRVRDGERPIPEALKAMVAALDEVEPAEIPGVASTGLLISELNVQIQELHRERAQRAEQLAALGKRLDRAELNLAASDQNLALQVRELDARQHEVERLREVMAQQRDELRVLRGTAGRVDLHPPELPPSAAKRGNGDAGNASDPASES